MDLITLNLQLKHTFIRGCHKIFDQTHEKLRGKTKIVIGKAEKWFKSNKIINNLNSDKIVNYLGRLT